MCRSWRPGARRGVANQEPWAELLEDGPGGGVKDSLFIYIYIYTVASEIRVIYDE